MWPAPSALNFFAYDLLPGRLLSLPETLLPWPFVWLTLTHPQGPASMSLLSEAFYDHMSLG